MTAASAPLSASQTDTSCAVAQAGILVLTELEEAGSPELEVEGKTVGSHPEVEEGSSSAVAAAGENGGTKVPGIAGLEVVVGTAVDLESSSELAEVCNSS